MRKKTMRNMTIAAMLGGMGVAGYMYMKNNPSIMYNMKHMTKHAAKKVYDTLDETR